MGVRKVVWGCYRGTQIKLKTFYNPFACRALSRQKGQGSEVVMFKTFHRGEHKELPSKSG